MTATIALISFALSFMHDYGVDQVTVQRLLSIGNKRGLQRAVFFNAGTDVIINAILLFIGLGLFAFFKLHPLPDDVTGNMILPYYIVNYLPQGISGLIITAVFAAAMSSLDSGINSISTVIVNDFVLPFKKDISEHTKVSIGRQLTLVLGLLAMVSAFYASSIGDIVKVTSSFLGMFSAPVLALFLLGIMTRRGSFYHWLPGVLISLFISFYVQRFTDVHWIYYFPVGFVSCFSVTLMVVAFSPRQRTAN